MSSAVGEFSFGFSFLFLKEKKQAGLKFSTVCTVGDVGAKGNDANGASAEPRQVV